MTLDKLSHFRKCCSGSPLLTGSIYLAVLGLIFGLIMVVLGSGSMINAGRNVNTVGTLLIVCGLLNFLAHGSLMFGSLKHNQTTLMAYLVLASLKTLLVIVVSVLVLFGLFKEGVYLFIIGTISTLVNAYSLIWVFHFYKELKLGDINNVQKA